MQEWNSSGWSTLSFPVVQRINDTIGGQVFQQDNSPVHNTSVVTEWFEQHSIQVDEHPPYSPDLDPIEHVWAVLKQQLHKQHPDIADTRCCRAQLAEFLPKAWDFLHEQLFDNLYRTTVCQIGWERLLIPRGGIQDTVHVFQFFFSHFTGGFVE